jgi:RNA polymerase sigma factor (sigma-70 family)
MSESASKHSFAQLPEEQEFDNLIRYFSNRHWKRTYAHAHSITRNSADAEDIAQETYIRLFQTFLTGRKIDSCMAWMKSVVRKVVIDQFRKARPDLHLAFVSAEEDENGGQREVVLDIADGSRSIEELLVEESLVQESLRVLADLPDRSRECVLMYACGYKFVQIAKALGMSYEVAIETTRKALARTRRGITRAEFQFKGQRASLTAPDQRTSKKNSEATSPTQEVLTASSPTQAVSNQQDRYAFGDIIVDVPARQVTRLGQSLDLSSKEFELLTYFLNHPQEILRRDRLLREVWGYAQFSETRTLDTHIARLRDKIEPETKYPRFVITVRGVGYKFVGST